MTFSIVGHCPRTDMVGVAITTCDDGEAPSGSLMGGVTVGARAVGVDDERVRRQRRGRVDCLWQRGGKRGFYRSEVK